MPLVHLNQVFIQDLGGQGIVPCPGLCAPGWDIHSSYFSSEALAAWEGISSTRVPRMPTGP